jgi:hypothetical protein
MLNLTPGFPKVSHHSSSIQGSYSKWLFPLPECVLIFSAYWVSVYISSMSASDLFFVTLSDIGTTDVGMQSGPQ